MNVKRGIDSAYYTTVTSADGPNPGRPDPAGPDSESSFESASPAQAAGGLSRYRIGERIGKGGVAEVFRGQSAGAGGFSRTVAIKRIRASVAGDAGVIDGFMAEAKLARRLSHGNIVQIYDVGVADGLPYLVMEYVNGLTLSELLQLSGPLRPADALHVIEQVCAALDHAHQLTDTAGRPIGVVHRDVHPRNILLSRDGVVKLTDFGIARSLYGPARTVPGLIKGTIGYLSPEQVNGQPATAASDQFAAGMVLHEMLGGNNPLVGAQDLNEYRQRLVSDVPLLHASSIDSELADIVARAVALDPDHRFGSIADLRAALEKWRVMRDIRVSSESLRSAVRAALGTTTTANVHNLDRALADQLDADQRKADPDRATRVAPTAQPKTPRWRNRIALALAAMAMAMAISYVLTDRLLSSEQARPEPAMSPQPSRSDRAMPDEAPPDRIRTATAKPSGKKLDSRPDRVTVDRPRNQALDQTKKPPANRSGNGMDDQSARQPALTPRVPASSRVGSAKPSKRSQRATKPANRPPGRIKINVLPYAEVRIDNKYVGRTPVNISLPPGRHRIELANPTTGKRVNREVTVQSDRVVTISDW